MAQMLLSSESRKLLRFLFFQGILCVARLLAVVSMMTCHRQTEGFPQHRQQQTHSQKYYYPRLESNGLVTRYDGTLLDGLMKGEQIKLMTSTSNVSKQEQKT